MNTAVKMCLNSALRWNGHLINVKVGCMQTHKEMSHCAPGFSLQNFLTDLLTGGNCWMQGGLFMVPLEL